MIICWNVNFVSGWNVYFTVTSCVKSWRCRSSTIGDIFLFLVSHILLVIVISHSDDRIFVQFFLRLNVNSNTHPFCACRLDWKSKMLILSLFWWLVYLFNINTNILWVIQCRNWFICKCFIEIIIIFLMFHWMLFLNCTFYVCNHLFAYCYILFRSNINNFHPAVGFQVVLSNSKIL